MIDCLKKGRYVFAPIKSGELNPNCKISNTTIYQIRNELEEGIPPKEIAAKFNIGLSSVSRIKKGFRQK